MANASEQALRNAVTRARQSGGKASRKRPVQEPSGRGGALRDVAVKAGAEQPEAQARFCLRRGNSRAQVSRPAVLAPPCALDALGAFGGDHFVQRAPPAKADGGPSGTSPPPRSAPACVSSRSGRGPTPRHENGGTPASRHRCALVCAGTRPRPLREYGCPARSDGARGARPAARSDDRPAGPRRRRRRRRRAPPAAADKARRPARRAAPVEAEAGIEPSAERRQPLDKQRAHLLGSRIGARGAGVEPAHLPSVRNSRSSRWRAPSPRRSSMLDRPPTARSSPSTSSSRAIGSAKGCSAT